MKMTLLIPKSEVEFYYPKRGEQKKTNRRTTEVPKAQGSQQEQGVLERQSWAERLG